MVGESRGKGKQVLDDVWEARGLVPDRPLPPFFLLTLGNPFTSQQSIFSSVKRDSRFCLVCYPVLGLS